MERSLGEILEKDYNQINKHLCALSQSLHEYERVFNQYVENYKVEKERKEREVKKKLDEYENKEKKLRAYIDIAAAHCTKVMVPEESYEYDEDALARLAVQINYNLVNDPNAVTLFCQASAQLKTLKKEKEYIKHNFHLESNTQLSLMGIHKSEYLRNKQKVLCEIENYLRSEYVSHFFYILRDDVSHWLSNDDILDNNKNTTKEINIGIKRVPFSIPVQLFSLVNKLSLGAFDSETCTIGIPQKMDCNVGQTFIVEYENSTENKTILGVQSVILSIVNYLDYQFNRVYFFDPVRYNNSSLGILAPLSEGMNSYIANVPFSKEILANAICDIIDEINSIQDGSSHRDMVHIPKTLMVFHDFPNGYDNSSIERIQQLCINAPYYGLIIIITHNNSLQKLIASDAYELIKTFATEITSSGNDFFIIDKKETKRILFAWNTLPLELPKKLVQKYIDERPIINLNNNYSERIGFEVREKVKKGNRELVDIPIGVDDNGEIVKINFTNSNFATFICGASRAGKSNLLQVLVTGIIKEYHPDDVEIWLIDFKMTTFSHYVKNTPPHIRYIVLDESPELIFDIIDRLTEIMNKRQNIFKGKWEKLSEISKDKYMPAILVFIDEFSVMSQVISDSIGSNRGNYIDKLQMLLAKGAALGLHFIFSCQGFTEGTRGLNGFSKKQIQQRIALKTEYNEIRETLDIRSLSDNDKMLMEQLPIYYALLRIPVDAKGNHLQMIHILYIDDMQEWKSMLGKLVNQYRAIDKYNPEDNSTYIDKKTMILDGNKYNDFYSKKGVMQKYIENKLLSIDINEETMIFLGEPQSMNCLESMDIEDSLCENVLIIVPNLEIICGLSIIMSIYESTKMQDVDIEFWTSRKSLFYQQLYRHNILTNKITAVGTEEVCNMISKAKKEIIAGISHKSFIFLCGIESILLDAEYEKVSLSDIRADAALETLANMTFERRKGNEPDLDALLENLNANEHKSIPNETIIKKQLNDSIKNERRLSVISHDIKADLNFILTQGPRLGYHFVLLFNNIEAFNQSKINATFMKHKLLFRMSKTSAMELIGMRSADIVEKLPNHIFRYYNGIKEMSYRPYLHTGLSWDGWYIDESGKVIREEQEDYLL